MNNLILMIKKLVQETPNDKELGEKIRRLFNWEYKQKFENDREKKS